MSLVGEAILLIVLLTAGALVLLFLPTRAEQNEPEVVQEQVDLADE